VLYVDDEPALCRAFERALRSPEYRVLTTTSAQTALELIAAEPFDVIASDYRMPELNGLDFLGVAREKNPGARRLLVSGRVEGEVDEVLLREADVDHVLAKPWSLDELRRVVRHAAEFAALARERAELVAQLARLGVPASARAGRDEARRVAGLARALGAALGLGDEALRALEEGAFLARLGATLLGDEGARLVEVAVAYQRARTDSGSDEAALAALEQVPGLDARVVAALRGLHR
jgi:DNA-binding response OmpR family regulator